MGFSIYLKKGEKAPDLTNQMLEMKKRSEPVKLKNTEPKKAPTTPPSQVPEEAPEKIKTNVELQRPTPPEPPAADPVEKKDNSSVTNHNY